jgi:predicted enzyme related to lactoylglutathione lyase
VATHVMHIAEVGLRVKDLARMVAFYQEVPGLEIVLTMRVVMCHRKCGKGCGMSGIPLPGLYLKVSRQ